MARKITTPAFVEEFVLNLDRVRAKNSNDLAGAKLAHWFERSDEYIVVMRMNEVKFSGREDVYWMVNRLSKYSRHSDVFRFNGGSVFNTRKAAILATESI